MNFDGVCVCVVYLDISINEFSLPTLFICHLLFCYLYPPHARISIHCPIHTHTRTSLHLPPPHTHTIRRLDCGLFDYYMLLHNFVGTKELTGINCCSWHQTTTRERERPRRGCRCKKSDEWNKSTKTKQKQYFCHLSFITKRLIDNRLSVYIVDCVDTVQRQQQLKT